MSAPQMIRKIIVKYPFVSARAQGRPVLLTVIRAASRYSASSNL